MKYQKLLAICFAALAFASCGEKEEDISTGGGQGAPSSSTSAFTATLDYTFNGLSAKDAAYGDFLVLYCEAGGQGTEYFNAWKNGNDKPGCEVNRRFTTPSDGTYKFTLENLKPDTEYDYCVCFRYPDGENSEMSQFSKFRTTPFVPEFSGEEAIGTGYQKTGLQTQVNAIAPNDLKYCSAGFVLSRESSPVLDKDIDISLHIDNQGFLSSTYDNLTCRTQYYCRPYVKASVGNIVVYGSEFSFTTKDFDETKVDLGLPSGICWSSCNLGADSYKENGNYYLYGDLTPNKSIDNTQSSWLYDKSNKTWQYVGEIAGTEHDPAHIRLGGKWRMPTKADLEELVANCQTKELLSENSYVLQFTANNGADIKVPFSGNRFNGHLYCFFKDGKAWDSDDSKEAGKRLQLVIPTGTQYDWQNGLNANTDSYWGYMLYYDDYIQKRYSEIYYYDGIEVSDCVGILHSARIDHGVPIRPVWDSNM